LKIGRELFERLPIVGAHLPARFLRFDGHRFDLPDASVDRIMCLDAFHHVPNPAEVLAEMARVLRPGGVAGFSEPGPGHSRTEQAQYEMRHYNVVENEIVLDDIERWARSVGLNRLEVGVFDVRPYFVSRQEYGNLLDGGVAAERYVDYVRHAAGERQAFFLHKEGASVADSRVRHGLAGTIRVTLFANAAPAGGEFRGEAEVTNTGANAWLPSSAPFGPVRLGVHLYRADGAMIDRDYIHVDLSESTGIQPGETVRAPFTVPAPPAGSYRFGFDLVSEHVCWFEMNGTELAFVDVTVA
jgi:hypothetical protein